MSFSADAGIPLTANTNYHVVVEGRNNTRVFTLRTTSAAEDSGAAAGWSIGDLCQFRSGTVNPYQACTNAALSLGIKGYSAGAITDGVTVSETGVDITGTGTVEYTVVLDSPPTAPVTVSAESSASGTATVTPASVTFEILEWNTPQTFTVAGVVAGSASVTHSATSSDSSYEEVSIASVDVTVAPVPAVVFNNKSVTAIGTGTATYEVTLATQPAGAVTVTPTSANADTATVATGNDDDALTFTSANWDTGQTVTVTGVTTGTTSITHEAASDADSDYDIAAAGSVGVTVEAATTLTVSLAATTVDENAGGVTVTATFSRAVTEATTVTFATTDGTASKNADFTVPASFTAVLAVGDTAGTATVTITDDKIDEDNETFTVSASGGGVDAAAVMVTITDDDAAGFASSQMSRTVVAGETSTYRLKLTSEPTHAVTVTPASADAGTATVATDNADDLLTFTPSNWSDNQVVTVTGVTAGSTSVTHTSVSSDGKYAISAASSPVAVTVTPAPAVVFNNKSVTVIGTGTATYEVTLATQPAGDVTVTPKSADTGTATVATGNDDNALTFTSANYSTAQTVTVTGVTTGTTSVTHVAASDADPDYDIATAGSVGVTVEAATTLTVSLAATTVGEDAGDVTVTATFSRAVTEATTVTFTTTDGTAGKDADFTVPATFTAALTVGATAATGTVTITDDKVHETDETFTVAASGGDLTAAAVTVTITDDDDPGVSLSRDSLTVTAGLTAKYTLVLDSKPSDEVVVTPLSRSPGTAGVASGSASLTFTADNWDTAQTVTVSGGTQGSATITHTATSTDSDYNTAPTGTLTVGSVTVTVNATGKTVAIDSTVVVTEGSDASLTVTLGEAAPVGGVGVSVAYDYSDTASSADTGTTTGTVTVAEGETTATLSVPIFDDELVENAEGFGVTISAPPAGWVLKSGQVTARVSITDNDAANAKIAFGSDAAATSELAVSAAEGAGSVNVPVTVSHLPQHSTTFAVEVLSAGTTAGSSDYTISTSSVTFDSSSSKTQNLVVSLTDNDLIGADVTLKLRIAAAAVPKEALGDNYARHASGSLATLTIEDDDTPGFTTSTDTLTVETGSTVTYTVKLSSQPTHSVTLTPASAATATATVATVNGDDLLTFTVDNWDTGQTVTVTGVTTGAVNVSHTSSSSDTNYAITTAAGSVAVTVTPPPGLVFNTESVTAVGTGTVTYTVKLATAPTDAVTVTPQSEATGTATVATANNDDALTFSTTNWDTGQTVTVSGVTTGTTSVTHTATSTNDSDYQIAAAGSVGVTVEAPPGVTVGETSVSVQRGSTVTYTVVLDTAPSADVEVSVTRR